MWIVGVWFRVPTPRVLRVDIGGNLIMPSEWEPCRLLNQCEKVVLHLPVHMVPMVRRSQGAKVNKDVKKVWTVLRRLHTTVQNIFLLSSLADYLHFHFWICSAAFVSCEIASDPTLVFCVNKLVRENDSFFPGKSGKSQGKWIPQSSRNHGYTNDLVISDLQPYFDKFTARECENGEKWLKIYLSI